MMSQQTVSFRRQGALSGNGTLVEAGANGSAQSVPRTYSATFEEIWRTHAKQILRVTQRITNNREDAEDALQDSFLRAYVHLHSFDGRSSIATWLTRIAINSALIVLRKRVGAPQLSIDSSNESSADVHSLNPADSTPNPEDQYGQLEQQTRVRSAIGTLRPSMRQALELHALEDKSVKETAERMGLSISATKSRIFHAKAALRESLGPKVSRRRDRARQLQLSPA